jgi:hypothetical protein
MELTAVGIDIAKNVFQVYYVDRQTGAGQRISSGLAVAVRTALKVGYKAATDLDSQNSRCLHKRAVLI